MSLIEKLKSNSTIKTASPLENSKIFDNGDVISTPIPMINVAFSGKLNGGFKSAGLTVFAGPSRHFKTLFGLICAKAYMDKYPDSVMIFYDSEYGSPPEYFKAVGLDTSRVLHVPLENLEQLKFDITNQLENIDRGDKVFIMLDSLGNLASKKEASDALNGKSVSDMTRAKEVKSIFRIVTPQLTTKDIPMMVISHTYDSMDLFPKKIVSGGQGQIFAANNIFIIGRRQEKDGRDVIGYDFLINVEKSRSIREKSVIPISVTYENGISPFSGLLEIAMDGGYVISPTKGWYQPCNPKTGEILIEGKLRKSEINTDNFWNNIISKTDFADYVESKYISSVKSLIQHTETDDDVEEIVNNEGRNDE